MQAKYRNPNEFHIRARNGAEIEVVRENYTVEIKVYAEESGERSLYPEQISKEITILVDTPLTLVGIFPDQQYFCFSMVRSLKPRTSEVIGNFPSGHRVVRVENKSSLEETI